MLENSKRIAIIPARASSKRIPDKNIRNFAGKPMIVYAIECALESKCFDEVIVSTENSMIASLSEAHGASIPFLRPTSLSKDDVRADAVFAHAIEELEKLFKIEVVCGILPTTPGLEPRDLQDSLDFWVQNKNSLDSVFAVTEYQNTAFRSFTMNQDGDLHALFPEKLLLQTQDLPKTYADAGQFYWARPEVWKNTRSITGEKAMGWVLPGNRAVDINTEEDWILAEKLIMKK
jgi:pseudaminic acid cytidylyltransferase